jgi:hypothetical protein
MRLSTQSGQEPGGIKRICRAAPTMIVRADNLLARGVDIAPRIQRTGLLAGSAAERPVKGATPRALVSRP